MLLQRHDALGRLPAIVALALPAGAVLVFGYLLLVVWWRAPLLLVPDAQRQMALAPARPDAGYARAFACEFLQDWATWTPATCRHRLACALDRLAPGPRAELARLTGSSAALYDSLQQSQSLTLDALEFQGAGGDALQARFRGRLTTYFGGVGGEADPVRGSLLLVPVRPSGGSPLCLEIERFRFERPPPEVDGSPARAPDASTVRPTDASNAGGATNASNANYATDPTPAGAGP